MSEKPSDPIMIITGTSRGIGLELARHYVQAGWCVAGCSRGEASFAHERYHHWSLDVSEEQDVTAMVREVVRALGAPSALLCNAGIASMNAALLSPAATAEKIFQTNFMGTFLFARETAKAMIRSGGGRIVTFTSVAAPLCLEGESLYASSKAAVETFTRTLANELGASAITVNAVGPSPLKTDLIAGVPEETMQRLLARQPLERYAEMDDVVNAVDFFLSPRSAMITGQTLYLGGVHG